MSQGKSLEGKSIIVTGAGREIASPAEARTIFGVRH